MTLQWYHSDLLTNLLLLHPLQNHFMVFFPRLSQNLLWSTMDTHLLNWNIFVDYMLASFTKPFKHTEVLFYTLKGILEHELHFLFLNRESSQYYFARASTHQHTYLNNVMGGYTFAISHWHDRHKRRVLNCYVIMLLTFKIVRYGLPGKKTNIWSVGSSLWATKTVRSVRRGRPSLGLSPNWFLNSSSVWSNSSCVTKYPRSWHN